MEEVRAFRGSPPTDTAPTQRAVRTVDLLGVRFDALTEEDAVQIILSRWADGEGGWVSTPNTHQLDLIVRGKDLRALVEQASLTVADGMPLVWASVLQGTPLPERVAGSSLVWSLARSASRVGASLFLLGGSEGVAIRAGQRLESEVPGLKVVGTCSPPFGFELDPDQIEMIRALLRDCQPDLVYVGLGFPKQERLIMELRAELPRTWFLGIGISLSFISGDVSRAPLWMQKAGLEWLYRLYREPARLFKRYIVSGIPFTTTLLIRSAVRRIVSRRRDRLEA